MSKSLQEGKRAVESGYFPLYRYNPTRKANGENPFVLDSKAPTLTVAEFMDGENRFASLKASDPETAERLYAQAQEECLQRFAFLQKLASGDVEL